MLLVERAIVGMPAFVPAAAAAAAASSSSSSAAAAFPLQPAPTLSLKNGVIRRSSRLVARCSSGGAEAEAINGGSTGAVNAVKEFQHLLLPIIDKNPYLSEATRQAAATATALAKKYGARITVVVIDEQNKEAISDYELRLKTIRWHLAEGGFDEYGMLEKLGEEKRPAVVVGEVADDMGLDLVVLSMESIHSKHIDGNLLAEFVPCPVLLLPL